MEVTLTQPKIYSNSSITGDYTYTVPVFDQEYEISLSYPDAAEGESYSGTEYPDYILAKDLSLIEASTYTWTALTVEELEVFQLFMRRFNNSWQPFSLTYNGTSKSYIINKEPAIERDRVGLYKLTLNLISYDRH